MAAEVITHEQHGEIMELFPEVPEDGDRLRPDHWAILASYLQFGPPFAGNGFGGLIDKRSDLYEPRQRWLDREVDPFGLSRDAYVEIWSALDADAMKRAQESLEAASKDG